MDEHKLSLKQKYLQDSVYGASDGIVTTFAIVAGVTGASLSPLIILILGFANLLADGFSMAVGSYLSRKSEREFYDNKREEELVNIGKDKKFHEEELNRILKEKGFKGNTLEQASASIRKNKDFWVEMIMMEGFGLADENKEPVKNGLATFGAFVIAGFMPLLAYVLAQFFPIFQEVTFSIAIVLTATTLVAVGMMKSSVTKRIWWKESGQMLFLGGAAAVLAYLVGYLVSIIV